MGGVPGYRSVSKGRPCAVCGHGSGCRETTAEFRLQISKGGVLHEVEAPGTVLCMRPAEGGVPGWMEHGARGSKGWQHYVPASVYADIKGGNVDGLALDAEMVAKRRREEELRAHQERVKKRQAVGKIWHMARTEAERAPGVEAYRAARLYLDQRVRGENGQIANGKWAKRDEPLPYCIRSMGRLAYYEEEDGGGVHKVGEFPCLLAAAVDLEGKVCGMQRIYLSGDCRGKLVGYDAKKMVGDFCPGAAVRIGSKEEFENPRVVIVCEGVETGWALRLATGLPILCVLSTAGMVSFALPPEWTDSQLGKLERVIFAKDHDRFSELQGGRPGDLAARSGAVHLRAKHSHLPLLSVAVFGPTSECAPGMVAEDERILLGEKDGVEGKSVDWLDVFVGFGAEAVCEGLGIQNAELGTGSAEREGKGGCDDEAESGRVSGGDVRGREEGSGDGAARSVHADSGWGGGDFGSGGGELGGDGAHDGEEGFSRGEGGARGKGRRGGSGGSEEAVGERAGSIGDGRSDDGGDGQEDQSSDGKSGEGGGGDKGQGGSGGVSEKKSGGGVPPIMPDGHLAQARDFLRYNAALSPLAAGRANQRWELAYLHEGKQWYQYADTHWEPVPETLLHGAVLHHFEPYHKFVKDGGREVVLNSGSIARVKRAAISVGNAKSVVEGMQTDCGVFSPGGVLPTWSAPTFDGAGMPLYGAGLRKSAAKSAPPKVIPFTNGLLRIDALMETSDKHPGGRVVLEKHTPNFISTSCAPFDFPAELVQKQFDRDPRDEEAGGELCLRLCPTFREVLFRAAGDCEIFPVEFMKAVGLSFTDDTTFEKIFYVTGRPGTGKGTLFEGVTAAVGEQNVYMSSANQLCGKFEIINYVGKNIIGFDEFETGHSTDGVEASRRLKTTGIGTATGVEGKNDDGFTTRITGKFWLISNKLAKLKDSSAAMARRLVIFPMAIDTPKTQDPRIKRKVKDEARGIAVWAMFHLRMLYRDQGFRQPPAGLASIENFKRLVSPVHAFVEDCMVPHPESMIEESLLRDLYIGYSNWAGTGRLGQENLYSELESSVHGLSRVVDKDRVRLIKGIRPRLEDERDQKDTLYHQPKDTSRMANFGFEIGGATGSRTETDYPPGGGGMFPPGV